MNIHIFTHILTIIPLLFYANPSKSQWNKTNTPLDSFLQRNYDSSFVLHDGSSTNLYIVAKNGKKQYFFRYKSNQGHLGDTPGVDCWITKELHKFSTTVPDTNRYFSVLSMKKYEFWNEQKIWKIWNITDNYKATLTCGSVDDGQVVLFTFISKNNIQKRRYYEPFYYASCDKEVNPMKNIVNIYRRTKLYFRDNTIDDSYIGGPGTLRDVSKCKVSSW